jgi:2-polyprenyl-6-methoxyphenol hydroxylase-like FAD-dependent oxidoreductase
VIIIIGGGIGGLTAAIALRRAGIEATVFERAQNWRELGAGLSLWRNALVALDAIGLGRAAREGAASYPGAALRTADGQLIVAPGIDRLITRFGELGVVIHRAALQTLLVDALGRDHIVMGRACTGVEQDASGVTAKFADGTRVQGAGLVGADGIHSVVRAALFGQTPPRYSGYTAWRGVVTFDHAALAVGESWGLGRRFGQAPLNDGRVYWFATHSSPPDLRSSDGEKAELLRLFSGWHRPIEGLIAATPPDAILRNDIVDRPPMKSWSRGRITLLGDAAHPMTPNLGQGGCQAIEDAIVLARSLRLTPDVEAAWRAYEAARIPRTREIVAASARVGQMGQWSQPAAVWFRTRIVRALGFLQVHQLGRVIGFDVGSV